ncbi:MAG TPA: MFS transporter [Rhizomicrobium sp.]|jgi:GPH family glycoside/pentoside/hexuronide:cation symporter
MTDIIAGQTTIVETEGAADAGGALPLSPVQKAVYASGDFVDGITAVAVGQFLLFYLSAVVGLSASLAGTALAVTLVVDALADPLIGYISDNTRSRLGRRHPFMIVGAPLLAVATGLLFSIPKIQSPALLFGYVIAILLLARFAYSIFFLPYIALGAELARDYADRSVLQVFRNFINISGNLVAVVLGFGIFMSGPGGLLNRAAYSPFGWTCCALIFIAALVSILGTMGVRDRMYPIAPLSSSAFARLAGELRDVFRNHSFLVLLFTIVIFWVAQGTAINLNVYTFTYFWKVPASVIQLVLIVGTAGLFSGIPLCALLIRKFEKKSVCTWGIVIVCALLILPPVLFIMKLLPQNGVPLVVALCVFAFIQSVVLTSVFISFNSMMVDATDEHDLLFGVRREGLYFAALSFSGKAALGIGALIAGFALQYIIGFPSDIADHPKQAIPDLTILKLGLIAGPGAAAISALSAFAMTRYRISKNELLRIQGELKARKSV